MPEFRTTKKVVGEIIATALDALKSIPLLFRVAI